MTLGEADLSSGFIRAVAFVWGCLWGSFLNVVIHRVPLGISIVHPGSHCPACGSPIRAYDNVPVLSWALLRGRARCCGAKISPRYALVEVLGGLLSIAIAQVVLVDASPASPIGHVLCAFMADFALAMALVAAAFIDASHMVLPDPITLGGTLFGLLTPGLRDLGFADALLGAAVGFVGVWLPLIVGYQRLRGRAGMGLGDAKLVMLAGAWFGWQGAAFALFAGATQATLAVVVMVLVAGKIEEPEAVRTDRELLREAASAGDLEAQRVLDEDPLATAPADGLMAARIPFGPFLCLAIIEWMLAGPWIGERVAHLSR